MYLVKRTNSIEHVFVDKLFRLFLFFFHSFFFVFVFVNSNQDIPTGADSCVTSLSCDSQRSLIAAGLGDGSVRVFDRRMSPNDW